MKATLLALSILVLTVFSYEWRIKQIRCEEEQETQRMLERISEQMNIIDAETQEFRSQITERFSFRDKYHIGQKLITQIDSITLLTDSILSIVSNAENDFETVLAADINGNLHTYTSKTRALFAKYFTSQSEKLGLSKEELPKQLIKINELISPNKLPVNYSFVDLILLESQIVNIEYELIWRLGSIFAYHGMSVTEIFPTIVNFGEIKPIKYREKFIVKIGVQSFEHFVTSEKYTVIILEDTLHMINPTNSLDYSLPTTELGKNVLPIKLMYEDRFTGETFQSESSIIYHVNE